MDRVGAVGELFEAGVKPSLFTQSALWRLVQVRNYSIFFQICLEEFDQLYPGLP